VHGFLELQLSSIELKQKSIFDVLSIADQQVHSAESQVECDSPLRHAPLALASLELLEVDGNLITDRGVEILVECLRRGAFRELTKPNLSANPIGDLGGALLAQAILDDCLPQCKVVEIDKAGTLYSGIAGTFGDMAARSGANGAFVGDKVCNALQAIVQGERSSQHKQVIRAALSSAPEKPESVGPRGIGRILGFFMVPTFFRRKLKRGGAAQNLHSMLGSKGSRSGKCSSAPSSDRTNSSPSGRRASAMHEARSSKRGKKGKKMTKFTQREMRNRFWVQVVAVRGRGRNALRSPGGGGLSAFRCLVTPLAYLL